MVLFLVVCDLANTHEAMDLVRRIQWLSTQALEAGCLGLNPRPTTR